MHEYRFDTVHLCMNWIPPNKHTFLVDCFTGSCCLSEGRITTDRCNVDTMVTTGRAVGVGTTRDGANRERTSPVQMCAQNVAFSDYFAWMLRKPNAVCGEVGRLV